MKFSLIILNYNTFEYTKNCLDSIFAKLAGSDFEVIVIDNASADGSGQKLKDIFGERAKFILNNNNPGFGSANNIGAKIAQGEYLLFLNSDTLIKDVSLTGIDIFFQEHKNLGIVGLDLLLENGKRQEFAFGEFLSPKNLLRRESNLGKEEVDYIEADWVSGAALIIRKKIFDELGGFDEKFFMYFEDMDLCRRAKIAGDKVFYSKKYSVIHFGGKSSRDLAKMKKDYYISQDYYFQKYYGFFQRMIVKILRSIYLFIIKNKK